MEAICQFLQAGSAFLIASHANPDGDAIASILGTTRLLAALGKRAIPFSRDPAPESFRFLPGFLTLQHEFPKEVVDQLLLVDCCEPSRAGIDLTMLNVTGWGAIDHHRVDRVETAHALIDETASATTELVYRITKKFGVEIDAALATCLYTGILTDTGSFRYSNTSPEAMAIAGELIGAGAKPWPIAQAIYETQRLSRIRLTAGALQSLEADLDVGWCSITITQRLLQETGADVTEIDGLINFPRTIEGAEVAIQFREVDERTVKVSFRSRHDVDVATVAKRFGGGGHLRAAGCTVSGRLSEVKAQIYELIRAQIRQSLPQR